jgi:hypothetical protein
MTSQRYSIFVISLSIALGACAPRRSDLIGTWRAELSQGYNLLILNSDGSFRQEVKLHDPSGRERLVSREGTWEYDDRKLGTVVLKNCLVPTEVTGELIDKFETIKGNCVYPLERDWGVSSRVRIGSVEGNPFYRLK